MLLLVTLKFSICFDSRFVCVVLIVLLKDSFAITHQFSENNKNHIKALFTTIQRKLESFCSLHKPQQDFFHAKEKRSLIADIP